MRKRNVQQIIYSALGEVLAEKGFRHKIIEEAFVRLIPGGAQKVYVSLLDYNSEFVFSLSVGIRLDAVAEIFNSFAGILPRYQGMTIITGTNLGYFTGNNPSEFKVSSESQAIAAVDQLCAIIREKVCPFLDRYQDIRSLDEGVNAENQNINGWMAQPARGMSAIILAFLSENPSIDRIIARHRCEMQDIPAPERGKLERLVAYIKDNPHT